MVVVINDFNVIFYTCLYFLQWACYLPWKTPINIILLEILVCIKIKNNTHIIDLKKTKTLLLEDIISPKVSEVGACYSVIIDS